jgi:hypothetical protein
MKTLLLLAVVVLLSGCGDPNYAAPPESKADRAMKFASGAVTPTDADCKELDVAPLVNGVSKPDGVIDVFDIIYWMEHP